MNRAEEHYLAWAMAQSARPSLNPDAHARLYVKIGAGEQHGAIIDLLEWHAHNGIELTPELDDQLRQWIAGYSGSDVEEALRRLVDRVSDHRSDRRGYGATTGHLSSRSAAQGVT